MNMLGLSYGDRVRVGAFELEATGRWLGMIKRSRSTTSKSFNGSFRLLRPVSARVLDFG